MNKIEVVHDPSPTKSGNKILYPMLQYEIEHISEVEQFLKQELRLLNQRNSFPKLKNVTSPQVRKFL